MLGVLVWGAIWSACSSSPIRTHSRAAVPEPTVKAVLEAPRSGPRLPKVVRRLVAEERELTRGNQDMVRELPDPSGRARATAEAEALAAELDAIVASIASGASGADDEENEVDSDALDAAIDKLLLLDTRVTLLHEKLRAATERTTAVVIDR
jgi:hypothetical protein